MERSLIVYYSRNGENYVNGRIVWLETGNTKTAALHLQKLTGSDIFEIVQTHPYSDKHMECIQEAKDDLNDDVRPQLKEYPESIDEYDTIYLAYPNYWNTMPMAVWTFLEHFDFTGKKIYPICTNEGSGMGRSESDIRKLCPSASLQRGLSLVGSQVNSYETVLKKWLKAESE